MTTKEAQQLVQKTFQNPFDKGQFVYFIKNLVNEIDESKAFHARGYIHEKYRDKVKTYERIGSYTDPDDNKIDILIVYLQKKSSIDLARTTLRNFVGDYLKERGEKEAGLIAFVSPNQKDWRFSLVKMEYKITETPSGRVKAKEEFTPAKRYSFLVGAEETSHTAQSRLVPILEDDANNPTLKQIEEAFNIEKVTKEFFEKYRDLYLWVKETLDEVLKNDKAIKADFAGKNIDTVDFGKKLLGQIVFLYFLQKKGWFGVKRGEAWGSGSKNFLRELFDKKHGDYKNFFNDVLEPLFYEALRNDRSHDDHYFSMFKCKIPFLNGGLFDPINNYDWKETDIILPNDLFSNSYKTKEGDIGTGILDIFDRYNFTVKEDEPLEKEVAVDPEMLGKVFENLLEVKDRKSKGTYYTPREIVHYMCQESLVNYLATELEGKVNKKDIETLIKYGEAAIEHDATSVEKKSKDPKYKSSYYKPKLPKSIEKHAKLIDEKLETIRICDPAVGSGAFPVGMMNEIIRIRNALTSYLKTKKGRMIYDFKRHAIQSCLYGVDIDLGAVEIAKLRLWLSLIVDEEDIKQIKPLPNLDYKVIQGNSLLAVEKNSLFVSHWIQELEKAKELFFNETSPTKKQVHKQKIDELLNQITNGNKEFDFEIYFSEVFKEKNGFDVVIANPPYVRKENLDKKTIKELEDHFTEEANGKLRHWSDDLYVHFIFQGITITKPRGTVTYITNDSFIGLTSKRRVRRLLLQYDLVKLIRCPRETFEAMIYTAVFLLRKNESKNKEYESGYFSYPSFQYNALGSIPYKVVSTLPDERLIFANSILKIYEKLTELDKVKQFLNVLDTGIHSGNVREKIFFKEKNKEGLHRLLQGKQIERWGIFWDRPEAKYKYYDISYEPKKQKGVGRKGRQSKHEEYWHFCGEVENHYQPERLLMRQSDDDLVVAYQSEQEIGRFYTDNTLFTVLPKNKKVSLKYAMALFNSKLLNAIYHFLSQEEGKTLAQVKTGLVDELPFILDDQKPIVELTEEILAVTKGSDYLGNDTKQAKVHALEKQIDQLVYKLYGLTPEEIKIVEAK